MSQDLAFPLVVVILCIAGLIIGTKVQNYVENYGKKYPSCVIGKEYGIIGGTNLDRFFVECVLSGADDFSKERNKQKAQLLAEKYNLKYPYGIEELYRDGLKEHSSISQSLEEERLAEKRSKELEEYYQLIKYSDLTGKEKRIAMLTDWANELRGESYKQDRSVEYFYNSGQQKERDWASMGGFASAIGGIGAGISTAVDIQRENAKIREENERRRKEVLPLCMLISNSSRDNRKKADELMQEVERTKTKLVSDESADSLMKKISFGKTEISVAETGAARISTTASLEPDFKIFEDVPAVVDGTILAEIYEDGEYRGTANLVIPVLGLGENVFLRGICLDCCNPGKKYTAKFTAENLWAMEM